MVNGLSGFGAGEGGDLNWSKVKARLTFDSSATTDAIGRNWTASGGATNDGAALIGTGASLKLDGGEYIYTATSTDFDLQNKLFSIECWVNPTSSGGRFWNMRGSTLGSGSNSAYSGVNLQCIGGGTNKWYMEVANATGSSWALNAMSPTTWVAGNTYFVQALRDSGGNVSMYVNGVQVLNVSMGSTAIYYPSLVNPAIGFDAFDGSTFVGRVDDFRYTLDVTRPVGVPTAPFPVS